MLAIHDLITQNMAYNCNLSSNSNDLQRDSHDYDHDALYGVEQRRNLGTQLYNYQDTTLWHTPSAPSNRIIYSAPTVPQSSAAHVHAIVPAYSLADATGPQHFPQWPGFTYGKLSDILNDAHICIGPQLRFASILAAALTHNVEYAYEECVSMKRTPQEILDGYIESERLTVQAWNEHRLGHATPEKLLNADPKAALALYDVSHNVADHEHTFPIRYSASHHGASFKKPGPLPCFEHPLASADRKRAARAQNTRINQAGIANVDKLCGSPLLTPATHLTARGRRHPKTPNLNSSCVPRKYNKLEGSPSMNLHFPQEPCNITIAELVCFLPQWLKSIDVIDRAISNGGSAGTIAKMINLLRNTGDDGIGSCSVLRMMQPSMRKREGTQYAHWAVGNHKPPPDHNPLNISVGGFRTPRQTHKDRTKGVANIAFKDLAKNVICFPQNNDMLDLTRCVQYHMHPAHQHEEWNFPDDFHALVRHLGGPVPVTPENLDRAVFDRWMPARTRHATELMFSRQRDANGRLLKQTHEETEDSRFDTQSSNYGESHHKGGIIMPKKRGRNGSTKLQQIQSPTSAHHGLSIDLDQESDGYMLHGSNGEMHRHG
jgi:hypothetical protein